MCFIKRLLASCVMIDLVLFASRCFPSPLFIRVEKSIGAWPGYEPSKLSMGTFTTPAISNLLTYKIYRDGGFILNSTNMANT